MYIVLSSSANRSQIHHGQHVIPSCLTGLSSQRSGLTILLKLNSECFHSEWSPSDCGQFYSSEVLISPVWNWPGVSHLRTPCLISKNKSNSWRSCGEVIPWPFLTHNAYALPWWGTNSCFSNVPTALFQIFAMSQLSFFFVIHSWRRFSTGKERYSFGASNKHELRPWFKKKKCGFKINPEYSSEQKVDPVKTKCWRTRDSQICNWICILQSMYVPQHRQFI